MDKSEIIERLKNIAGHAVHTVGGSPFVMSLDDGIAVHEAIELLEKCEPLTDRDATDRWEIDAVGLEEEIRCEMCENPMHTARGCDGMCSYDEGMYKCIVKVLDNRMKPLQPATVDESKYEYHYDHTDCIWYRPEARNRCPVTCAQYRDGWNDAMNYIFRDGKGYRPFRRDKEYGE